GDQWAGFQEPVLFEVALEQIECLLCGEEGSRAPAELESRFGAQRPRVLGCCVRAIELRAHPRVQICEFCPYRLEVPLGNAAAQHLDGALDRGQVFLDLIDASCLRGGAGDLACPPLLDRKSTRLNSSHVSISYAVF